MGYLKRGDAQLCDALSLLVHRHHRSPVRLGASASSGRCAFCLRGVAQHLNETCNGCAHLLKDI